MELGDAFVKHPLLTLSFNTLDPGLASSEILNFRINRFIGKYDRRREQALLP